MIVHVKMMGVLKKYGDNQCLWVKNNTSIQEVIEILDIPKRSVALVSINNARSDMHAILRYGDTIKIVGFVAGG
ncbi:sulfur carrier protein ThiS [Acidaminobacter sp. JC074]|uniref:MoaD/ThiS family protein n=1 Tax=Acidaminobacter sp. JC074 TaxID=2530199 RepID=UPI001F100ECC|nr:MoaD/ThiS family protein [Acidaminobacter sp. JC074]MCH4890167.1 sulfur carrier protein ThiS [Acidaminobacter sp. JC074]